MAGDSASVSVGVVPNADDFWVRFVQQTRPGADRAGRELGSDLRRSIQEELARGVNVRVRADTSGARADVDRFRAEANRSFGSAQSGSGGLLKSLLTLAPALVPLAGAAAVGGAALAAMGVTGAIAVKSIETEIKSGSDLGKQYASSVGQIKLEFAGLEHQIAASTLPAFEAAQFKLSKFAPELRSDLAQIAPQLGDIGNHLLGGLIGGLHTFLPALQPAIALADRLAGRFESWANGSGGTKFAASLSTDFQQVVPVLGQIVELAGHLVAAANGPGLGIVSELGTLASVLNEIPIPVLSALITGIVGLRAAGTVTGLMDRLAVSIRGVNAAQGEGGAASGFRSGLSTTVGVLGKVAAGYFAASIAGNALKQSAQGSLTAIDDNTRHLAQFSNAAGDLLQLKIPSVFKDLGKLQGENTAAYQAKALQQQYKDLTSTVDVAAVAIKKAQGGTLLTGGGEGNVDKAKAQAVTYYANQAALATEQSKALSDAQQHLNLILAQTTGALAQKSTVGALATTYGDVEQSLQGTIDSTGKFLALGGTQISTFHGVAVTQGQVTAATKAYGLSQAQAIGYVRAQILAQQGNQAALAKTVAQGDNLNKYLSDASGKLGLTTDQTNAYTAALGINVTAIAQGGAGLANAEAQLSQFSATLANGSTSLNDYVAAVAAFSSSADTAASRGQLIGATLKAANGPLLEYANTMVQAATANQQLVTDFGAANKSIFNLKKGTIDFHNAGAAPLLNDFANLQTAAVNSAAATYQYETSQHKAGAANDAFNVYVNNTKGALEKEASQMGLTKGQADRLATSYFGIKNSGDLKKQIGLLGGDKVLTALQGILADLDIISGKTVTFTVAGNITTSAKKALAISGKDPSHTTSKSSDPRLRASGGGAPEGYFWVGDGGSGAGARPELVHKAGSQVDIMSFGQSVAFASAHGIKIPGFAAGTNPGEQGGYTGVKFPGTSSSSGGSGSSSSGSSKAAAAAKKTSSDLKTALDAVKSSLSSFLRSLSGSAQSINQASSELVAAAKKAKATRSELATLNSERTRLGALASSRDNIAARLGSAPVAPTAYDRLATAQQAFSDTKSSVSSAFSGTFNIAQSGVNAQVYNDVAATPVSASSILRQLTVTAGKAVAFGAALKTLAKSGLPQALLLQLAQAGPDALPQALALQKATPGELAGIKHQFGNLTSVGATAGSLLATDLNGAGVAAAQGLIAGLKSQEGALKKQMQHLADVMAAQIRKDLKIHSPSQVFHEFGVNTGEGLRLGIESKYSAVANATQGLAHAASPASSMVPLRAGSGLGGGITQHVYPAAGLDEVAVAHVTANRLLHSLATL